jgi:hypothetical protein
MRTGAALLVLQAVVCLSAIAQEAKPQTYAGFEGKTVSKVEISVRPAMDAASFRALLKIKPGDPFSSAAVQASVSALDRTKQFSKVQVSVEPEQAGLAIQFILEPALVYRNSYVPRRKAPVCLHSAAAGRKHPRAITLFRRSTAASTNCLAEVLAGSGVFLGGGATRSTAR